MRNLARNARKNRKAWRFRALWGSRYFMTFVVRCLCFIVAVKIYAFGLVPEARIAAEKRMPTNLSHEVLHLYAFVLDSLYHRIRLWKDVLNQSQSHYLNSRIKILKWPLCT